MRCAEWARSRPVIGGNLWLWNRDAPSNKRMKLSIALASAPRDTEEGHSACPPFGGHRALAAYPRRSTDSWQRSTAMTWGQDVDVMVPTRAAMGERGGVGQGPCRAPSVEKVGRIIGARHAPCTARVERVQQPSAFACRTSGWQASAPIEDGLGGLLLSNKRMKLSIVLAPPPRSTSGGGYACSPFGE